MALLIDGYHQAANGYWVKDSDNTGPYVHVTPGVFAAATGGSGASSGVWNDALVWDDAQVWSD